MVKLKRIYEVAGAEDGYRVLVDRLWPRGVSKDKAALDLWLKDIAPSPQLRTWFGHDPKRFEKFSHLYSAELKHNPAVKQLLTIIKSNPTVTLLYGARNTAVNHAAVLAAFLAR